jgi:neutral ceramidase
MNKKIWVVITGVLISLFFIQSGSSEAGESGKESLFVGMAKINITPGVPVVMSGYSARKDPFKGIHDELFATAIVFNDGTNKAAIISAEVIGFSFNQWDEITKRIEKETGIQQKYILLSPVHNHGGPSTRLYTDNPDKDLVAYNEELKNKLVTITKEAANSLGPALIGSGKGICKMNMNRRARNFRGGLRLGKNPYGPCDHEVGVVRIDDTNGNPMALFINWPCHATTMGGKNYQITGDWPGATRRFVEKEYNNTVIVSITAGASANIDPIYRVLPDFNNGETEEIGIILGEEVVKVSKDIQTHGNGSISAIQQVITLPGKERGESYLPQATYKPGPEVNVRLSLLKVGDIIFAGVSGELFTEIGLKIKEISPFKYTYVLTHCNGSSGYLISDAAYPEGGYEVQTTRVMSGAEQGIVDTMAKMMAEL